MDELLPKTLEGRGGRRVAAPSQGFTRDGAKEAIVARGGKSPGSVSKKTLALVIGAEPGASKVTKAEEAGVPVIDEAAFVQPAGDRGAAGLTRLRVTTSIARCSTPSSGTWEGCSRLARSTRSPGSAIATASAPRPRS